MRRADDSARKKEILLATISEYIDTAIPVSSEILRGKYGFDLSSATIRNVLSRLEEEGYLMHPHTSAGRIPTDKGYRYYLEYLLEREEWLTAQKNKVLSQVYFGELLDLEFILEKASDILAELTHYTGIVSSARQNDKFYFRGIHFLFEQPEFKDIEKVRAFLTILEERQRLLELVNNSPSDSINVYVGGESHCEEMQDCALVTSAYSRDKDVVGRLGVIGPKRMNYSKVISVLDSISKKLTEVLNDY